MASRAIWGNRTAYHSRDYKPQKRTRAPLNVHGTKFDPSPIPAGHAESPLRAGVPYHCPEDDIVYRVVERLDPVEGWVTADFWLQRYDIGFDVLRGFVLRGWMDAAFEAASPTKRFRCRDEAPIERWLQEQRPRRKNQIRRP